MIFNEGLSSLEKNTVRLRMQQTSLPINFFAEESKEHININGFSPLSRSSYQQNSLFGVQYLLYQQCLINVNRGHSDHLSKIFKANRKSGFFNILLELLVLEIVWWHFIFWRHRQSARNKKVENEDSDNCWRTQSADWSRDSNHRVVIKTPFSSVLSEAFLHSILNYYWSAKSFVHFSQSRLWRAT